MTQKNKLMFHLIVFIICILLLSCSLVYPVTREVITETDDLFLQLKGYIIIDKPGDISAIELPFVKHSDIIERCKADGRIKALSAPDKKGRVAFISDDLKTYSLSIVDMWTKKEIKIFTRQGSSWPHEKDNYGRSIAIADNNGIVAYVRNYKSDSRLIPDDYLDIGSLKIVDIEKKSEIDTDVNVIDKGMAWFPGGDKLLYSGLVPKLKVDKKLKTQFEDGFGNSMINWQSIPVVMTLDLKDMSTRQLHIGWNPHVTGEGSAIVIQDYEGRIRLYDIARGDSIPVNVPIDERCHVFSSIGKDYLLYKTIPYKDRKQRWTSTFGRTPLWTLRIAQMNTKRFKTVVQDLDKHRRVSYGIVEEKK